MSSAESYARLAMMLANGGEWNGVRIVSPATVQLMGSAILPDTLPGRQPGEGYGLGVRSITDRAARRTLIADGKLKPQQLIGREISLEEAIPALVAMDRATDLGISVITRF